MSWSASGTAENGEVAIDLQGVTADETLAQAQEASKAVHAILKSGALGDPKGKYYVTVSGHANPDHAPVAGWANDHLTISISQATKEEEHG